MTITVMYPDGNRLAEHSHRKAGVTNRYPRIQKTVNQNNSGCVNRDVKLEAIRKIINLLNLYYVYNYRDCL